MYALDTNTVAYFFKGLGGVGTRLMAGAALARGAVLVSRNTREFSRVAGLQVESWYDEG